MSICVLPALLALSSPIEAEVPQFTVQLPERASTAGVESFVGELTASAAWLRLDPTWRNVDGFDTQVFRFGARQVVRITPHLDSELGPVRVQGADRVITLQNGAVKRTKIGTPLVVEGRFVLDGQQALQHAIAGVATSILDEKTAKKTTGLVTPIFLRQGKVLRAAWKVRVPTYRLEDLCDVWIDAETGQTLLKMRAAHFAAPPRGEVQP